MTVTYETSIQDFDFWGQAKELVSRLTRAELEMIEEVLEETSDVEEKVTEEPKISEDKSKPGRTTTATGIIYREYFILTCHQ